VTKQPSSAYWCNLLPLDSGSQVQHLRFALPDLCQAVKGPPPLIKAQLVQGKIPGQGTYVFKFKVSSLRFQVGGFSGGAELGIRIPGQLVVPFWSRFFLHSFPWSFRRSFVFPSFLRSFRRFLSVPPSFLCLSILLLVLPSFLPSFCRFRWSFRCSFRPSIAPSVLPSIHPSILLVCLPLGHSSLPTVLPFFRSSIGPSIHPPLWSVCP